MSSERLFKRISDDMHALIMKAASRSFYHRLYERIYAQGCCMQQQLHAFAQTFPLENSNYHKHFALHVLSRTILILNKLLSAIEFKNE